MPTSEIQAGVIAAAQVTRRPNKTSRAMPTRARSRLQNCKCCLAAKGNGRCIFEFSATYTFRQCTVKKLPLRILDPEINLLVRARNTVRFVCISSGASLDDTMHARRGTMMQVKT